MYAPYLSVKFSFKIYSHQKARLKLMLEKLWQLWKSSVDNCVSYFHFSWYMHWEGLSPKSYDTKKTIINLHSLSRGFSNSSFKVLRRPRRSFTQSLNKHLLISSTNLYLTSLILVTKSADNTGTPYFFARSTFVEESLNSSLDFKRKKGNY